MSGSARACPRTDLRQLRHEAARGARAQGRVAPPDREHDQDRGRRARGLERNDISKLPGGIFGRAFVRSFATEVGLDPEATIVEFIAQFRDDSVVAGHPPSEQIEDNEALESKRRIAGTFLGLIALSVPIVAGLLYFATIGAAPRQSRSGQPPDPARSERGGGRAAARARAGAACGVASQPRRRFRSASPSAAAAPPAAAAALPAIG